MAGSFSVNTAFTAKDRMSNVFKKMGKSSSLFGSMLKANIAGAAIQKGIGLLVGGLRTVTTEYLDFQSALISSGAKFSDVNAATVEGQQKLKELGMVARQVGATTIFSATEAAQGLDFLAMAGFNATEAMTALPQVTNLAVVAQTDLATATDIASDSIGAFGLGVEDLTTLNDVMAKTMTTSNTDMINMFEAIKKGAPSFTAAGQSLFSFNALLGVMANSGVKGSEAGTALRNVMLRLASPTAEAQAVMDKLGVVTQDQSGNFLDVIDIIGQFEKGLAGMGTQQRSAALATVFGARTVTGMNLLLQEGTENLKSYREQLIGSTGASGQMAGVIGSSLSNRLKGLKSALIEAGFTFVSVFDDKAGGAIDRLTSMVRNVDLTKLALQIDNLINKAIDNLPLVKEKFLEILPAIQQTISDIGTIAGAISGMIAKITAFSGGPMMNLLKFLTIDLNPFIKFLELSNKMTGGLASLIDRSSSRRAEREQERQAVEAPNRREAEARQMIQFQGNLDITGAPAGSSFNSETRGAPPIRTNMLGLQP